MPFTRTLTALAVGLALTTAAVAQRPAFFRIGTGGAGGTYFPIGGTIANAISSPPGSKACEDGGSCGVPGLISIAQSTNASVANNAAVQAGQLEAGMTAADALRDMYRGAGKYEGNPHDKLRIVANLFPKDLHLVVAPGTELGSLAPLKDKRVGIAQAGSGTQVAVLAILDKFGVNRDNMEEAELNNSQSAERLADGQLDAYFYAAGWPVAAMVQLASTKGMDLYKFTPEEIASANEAVPAYIESVIPGGTYEGVDEDTPTVAVSAMVVNSADQDEELVYQITKALWNDNTRKLLDNGHPKGKLITSDTALDGVSALEVPLHPGAERLYKEAGLLQ